MEHKSYIKEIPGNGPIFFQSWLPSEKPKAIMILIHGFGEHSSRYGTHFAEFYTASRIGIFTFDLPGHGKTPGKRGHIANPFALLETIDLLIKQIKSEYPETPLFLYGHSFGGEILLWYTLVRNPLLNGMIITSPLIGLKEATPPMKYFLAKLMDKIFPTFTMDNGLNSKYLSRDPEVVNAYNTDPLVHRKISARSGMMVMNRGQWILENAIDNKNKMLIMIGSDEGIVNKESVEKFYELCPSITYKVWPGLYHELHNEPEKDQIFDFSLKWLIQNI
jgi:acylglycerol lipase